MGTFSINIRSPISPISPTYGDFSSFATVEVSRLSVYRQGRSHLNSIQVYSDVYLGILKKKYVYILCILSMHLKKKNQEPPGSRSQGHAFYSYLGMKRLTRG